MNGAEKAAEWPSGRKSEFDPQG